MLNRVILIGRLTKDPELRNSKNGKSFLYFTVALNNFSSFNNQNNQAEYIDCVAWEKVADSMANNLKKGALIAIDGRLQSRTVTQGNMRSKITDVRAISVKFLQSKGTINQAGNFKNNSQNQSQSQNLESDTFDIDRMNFDFVEQSNSATNENQNLTFDVDDAIAWGE